MDTIIHPGNLRNFSKNLPAWERKVDSFSCTFGWLFPLDLILINISFLQKNPRHAVCSEVLNLFSQVGFRLIRSALA
jgi:hypothetical protein